MKTMMNLNAAQLACRSIVPDVANDYPIPYAITRQQPKKVEIELHSDVPK